MKKISIVTISFNQAQYLKLAIESILSQEYNDLEYIIVDPGSTDESRKIINSYKDRISKIIFKPDSGPAEGLNNGFAEATGEIFGYLNADDILLPGTLSRVNKIFQNNSEYDVISAHGYIINELGEIQKKIFSQKFNVRQYLYENCILVQQSTFFKANIFRVLGGFNLKNSIAWDGELFLNMSKQSAKFKVFQEYWSGFRIYDTSITGNLKYADKIAADYIRLREINRYPEVANYKKRLFWLLNWINNPVTLIRRIKDQLVKLLPKGLRYKHIGSM